MELAIGDLSRRTGVKVPTIRYYEQIGLLAPPARTEGQQRRYGKAEVRRLDFIRHARELGFPLDDVRALLRLADEPDRPCVEADTIARGHLGSVRSRIARLQALEAELVRMVDACGHGKVGECRVIEVLADQSHEHCLHQGHGGTGL